MQITSVILIISMASCSQGSTQNLQENLPNSVDTSRDSSSTAPAPTQPIPFQSVENMLEFVSCDNLKEKYPDGISRDFEIPLIYDPEEDADAYRDLQEANSAFQKVGYTYIPKHDFEEYSISEMSLNCRDCELFDTFSYWLCDKNGSRVAQIRIFLIETGPVDTKTNMLEEIIDEADNKEILLGSGEIVNAHMMYNFNRQGRIGAEWLADENYVIDVVGYKEISEETVMEIIAGISFDKVDIPIAK